MVQTFGQNVKCAVPENIHIPPAEVISMWVRGWGVIRPINERNL